MIEREPAPPQEGARSEVTVSVGPWTSRRVARQSDVVERRQFVETQERGPFASWKHTHRFLPHRDGGSTLEDAIRFDAPGGIFGRILLDPLLQRSLAREYAFRHARVRDDLRRHAEIDARFGARSLRIGVTGAGGVVGRQLCAFLSTGGHTVVKFVRSEARRDNERRWDPTDVDNGVHPSAVEDLDVVIHLAGESIAAGRWSPARKTSILNSRTQGTAAMARAIARAARKPEAFLSASAIGFYGSRGDERVDETSTRGNGFLADVVHAWEHATQEATDAGVRTVHMRFGVILTAAGGALQAMQLPFRLGLGGRIGSGRQGVSWIALDDAIGAVLFAARHATLAGAVNLTAPSAVTQREFASMLGRVLWRPTIAPLPACVVRALLGELGQSLLLDGAFVRPSVLEREGFRFAQPTLEGALRMELGRLART